MSLQAVDLNIPFTEMAGKQISTRGIQI